MLTVSKKVFSALQRLAWNKVKTIKNVSLEKNSKKNTIKVSFYLPSPYSADSSLLIIVRNNGTIDKWSSIFDNTPPEKETIDLFNGKDLLEFDDSDANAISKQLLKEIVS
jgi:hypothetical protein